MSQPAESDVTYSDAILEDSARSFVRHFFTTTYGRVLLIASAVNVFGFALVIFFGIRDWFMLFVVGMIAALGPVYLASLYFLYPRRIASALKERLQPAARVTVSPSGFGIAANGRTFALPWSDIKSIIEFPDYFVLIVSRLVFTVISKKGLSEPSLELIRTVSRADAV